MVTTHFLEDTPLRELVAKTTADTPEFDVLAQVQQLSLELFYEDCIEEYAQPGKAGRLWVMWDYGSPKSSENCPSSSASTVDSECPDEDDSENPAPGFGGRPRMLGFLVAKMLPSARVKGGEAFTIVYAGVPSHLRSKGIGRKLVASVIKQGRARQNIAIVTLSALPGAIRFWERCGLTAFPDAVEVKEGSVPGQVYMEKCVRGKKGKSKKR